MAEAIARHWLDAGELGDGKRFFVASAGLAAANGAPMSSGTVAALKQIGIDAEAHASHSKGLSAEMIRHAAIVLCMTEDHAARARRLVRGEPEHEAKIVPLDPKNDMDDPIGMGDGAYHSLARRMKKLIPQRLKELLSNEDRPRVGSSR